MFSDDENCLFLFLNRYCLDPLGLLGDQYIISVTPGAGSRSQTDTACHCLLSFLHLSLFLSPALFPSISRMEEHFISSREDILVEKDSFKEPCPKCALQISVKQVKHVKSRIFPTPRTRLLPSSPFLL